MSGVKLDRRPLPAVPNGQMGSSRVWWRIVQRRRAEAGLMWWRSSRAPRHLLEYHPEPTPLPRIWLAGR